MDEIIKLTVNNLAVLLLLANIIGIASGGYMVMQYVKARGIKTKAQRELHRLVKFINLHHPEAVREGSPVDIAIDLIKEPKQKEKWRMD